MGFSPNSELEWAKDVKEFIMSIAPNTARMTTYRYAVKPILKMLKNPKHLKCIICDGYVEVADQINKSIKFEEEQWIHKERQRGIRILSYEKRNTSHIVRIPWDKKIPCQYLFISFQKDILSQEFLNEDKV